MSVKVKIEGLDELENMFRELGKVPQKCVTKGAKAGANIALAAAKSKAPKDIGNLRKGIILKGEKKTINGKKVYDIMMNPAMNNIFVKESNGNRYYYPASMEFGFLTKAGIKIPGLHFLRDSLINHKSEIEQATLAEIIKQIDKEMR